MAGRRRADATAPRGFAGGDGVLLRCVVPNGPWAEDLPPVPAGSDVTVSFGSSSLADEHCDALALLGYRVVDLPATLRLEVSGVADFLVDGSVMERHPTYWRSLAAQAVRAYHLGLGPAAALVHPIVEAHTRAAAVTS